MRQRPCLAQGLRPGSPSGEDLAGMFDLDGDDDIKISGAEIAGVLREVVGDARTAPAPAPAPRAPPRAAVTAPPAAAPAANSSIGPRVDERIAEFQRAAIAAKQAGDVQGALGWMRQGKSLQAAIKALLEYQYPAPGSGPPPPPAAAVATDVATDVDSKAGGGAALVEDLEREIAALKQSARQHKVDLLDLCERM